MQDFPAGHLESTNCTVLITYWCKRTTKNVIVYNYSLKNPLYSLKNRGSKYVKVAGGARVPYDHLILCTGQQYQTSCPTGAEVSTKLVTNASLPQSPNSYYKGRVPKNVFTVNDEYDACRVVKWINKYFLNSEGTFYI